MFHWLTLDCDRGKGLCSAGSVLSNASVLSGICSRYLGNLQHTLYIMSMGWQLTSDLRRMRILGMTEQLNWHFLSFVLKIILQEFPGCYYHAFHNPWPLPVVAFIKNDRGFFLNFYSVHKFMSFEVYQLENLWLYSHPFSHGISRNSSFKFSISCSDSPLTEPATELYLSSVWSLQVCLHHLHNQCF